MASTVKYYTRLYLSQEEFQSLFANGEIQANYSKILNKFMLQKLKIKTTANKPKNNPFTITFQLKCTLCKENSVNRMISVSVKKFKIVENPVEMDVTGSCHHILGNCDYFSLNEY